MVTIFFGMAIFPIILILEEQISVESLVIKSWFMFGYELHKYLLFIVLGQVRSADQDYSCSMLLYHVISTTCSHAGGWGSTALAGHSSRSMLVSTQN